MNSREMAQVVSEYMASLLSDRHDAFENWKGVTIREQMLDDILGKKRTPAAERRLKKAAMYVMEKKLRVPLNFQSPKHWREMDD